MGNPVQMNFGNLIHHIQARRHASLRLIGVNPCHSINVSVPDVSFHGSEFGTPHFDELARAGIILDQHYVQARHDDSNNSPTVIFFLK